MDLRTAYPRSVKERLGGYVHLARMIDKVRAKAAGTLGDYIYPCPLDVRLLEFLGIAADDFIEAVNGRGDGEILAWVRSKAVPHTETEIERWNAAMLSRGPDTDEKWTYFRGIRDRIDPARTDVTTWADLLDLEEGRLTTAGPAR
jgi:Domain of unknown function (DUF5069)